MNLHEEYAKLGTKRVDLEKKLSILNRQLRPLRQEKHRATLENQEYSNPKLTEGEILQRYYHSELENTTKQLNAVKKAIRQERSNLFCYQFVDVAKQYLDAETFERIKTLTQQAMEKD